MPLSRSAVDKLGERLRSGDAAEGDWTLLEELRDLRRQHLDLVITLLRDEFTLAATGRVKTINTLVEKLRRGRTRLSRMDDVAGARIKVNGGRSEQDDLVARLVDLWPDARVKDRRHEPMHGYRAVHVIPTIEGWPLEIQVRTLRQDTMANILERTADRWGRQIRYGGGPDDGEQPAFGPDTLARADFVRLVKALAEAVALGETGRIDPIDQSLVDSAIADISALLDLAPE